MQGNCEQHLDTIPREGELNGQINWSRPSVKERARPINQRAPRDRCCARSFWHGIRKADRKQRKTLGGGSSEDRGCSTSALGESSGERWRGKEGRSDSWQTHTFSSRAQEDCRCTKGSMGKGEDTEENGVARVHACGATRSYGSRST